MRTTRLLLGGALTLALVGGLSAAGMAQDDEPVPADPVAATEANETANLDAIMATYAEDAIFEDETFGDHLEGKAALRAMMGAVLVMTDWDATEVLDRFLSGAGSRAVVGSGGSGRTTTRPGSDHPPRSAPRALVTSAS